MLYGLFQYYTDELADWSRILAFHKEESGGFERRITVALGQKNITSDLEKESGKFLDLFLVQHQEFDHIIHQIASQQQRLQHNGQGHIRQVENPIENFQNSLRTKMQSVEKNFIRTKYSCSVFLSSFLYN